MFPSRGMGSSGGDVGDGKKPYDQYTSQWMREALESRQVIEELKALNDKLQREVYSLNSKVGLIYECCGDLGVVDRVGDLMRRKLREFQAAKAARDAGAERLDSSSPRSRKKSAAALQAEADGIICGSPSFHELAGFASSYDGQIARETFRRRNMFDHEEARLHEQFDIFGNPKQPSPSSSPGSSPMPRKGGGDTIDSLLSASSPAPSRPYGSAPVVFPTPDGLSASPSYGAPLGGASAYR